MPKADLPTAGRAPITGQIARLQAEDQPVKIRNSGQNPVISQRDRRSTSSYTPLASSSMRTMRPGWRVQTAQSGTQRVGAGVHVLALGQPPAKVAGHGIGAPGPEKAPEPGDVVPRARPRYRKAHAPDQVFRHVRLACVAQGALHAQRLDGLAPLLKPPHAR